MNEEFDIQQYAAESFMLYAAYKKGRVKMKREILKMIEKYKKEHGKSASVCDDLKQKIRGIKETRQRK